jgi:hypothetical protein
MTDVPFHNVVEECMRADLDLMCKFVVTRAGSNDSCYIPRF